MSTVHSVIETYIETVQRPSSYRILQRVAHNGMKPIKPRLGNLFHFTWITMTDLLLLNGRVFGLVKRK